MATPIPDNAAELSLSEIAVATGAQLRPGAAASVRGVTTDSRGDVRGKLFVALEGEHFDAHAFVPAAAAAGAAAVMVSKDVDVPANVGVARVESTLSALGALAGAFRRRWGGRVVAVAGSAGKTTTKSAIAAALSAVFPGAVHVAAGNLNNLVGVPMVLLGLRPEHRVAVVEVGTNQRGEVARLAAVCAPDVGVLTLIAVEHAEGIGSLDDIEAEEGELLAALGPAGIAVGNGDDERVRRQLERSAAGTRLSYGSREGSSYRLVLREPRGLSASRITIARPSGEPLVLDVPLLGLPGALASTAAVAVAERLAGVELTADALQRAFGARALGEPGRLRPLELADGTVVVDDTYNANPASVLAAVDTAREIARARGARLVLVVGEMRELGRESRSEHEKLGSALSGSGAEALVAIAGDARLLADRAGQRIDAVFAADAEQAIEPVLARVRPGDVVLVKASRGVRAERVVEALQSAKGRRA